MGENQDRDPKVYDGEFTDLQPNQETSLIERGRTLQQAKAGYQTALSVQRPREITRVLANCLKEAELAGKEFFYRWPVKDKRTGQTKIIQDLSVGGQMCLAREWTNAVILSEDVTTEGGTWIFAASFVDLERGVTFRRLFRKAIPMTAPSSYDVERWQDMQFQIGQSKALRNVIKEATPRWIQKQILERAQEAELNEAKKEPREVRIAKMIQYFGGHGISVDRIEKTIGKPLNDFSDDDLLTLRSFAQQIKDGESSANELFPYADDKKEMAKPPVNVTEKKTEKPAENAPPATPAPAEASKPTETAKDPQPEEKPVEQSQAKPEEAKTIDMGNPARVAMMELAGEIDGRTVSHVLEALGFNDVLDVPDAMLIPVIAELKAKKAAKDKKKKTPDQPTLPVNGNGQKKVDLGALYNLFELLPKDDGAELLNAYGFSSWKQFATESNDQQVTAISREIDSKLRKR